jgi:site-specific DNA-methyltransferase (adenine-specific)
MKEIPSGTIDLILCDLPFGCLHGGNYKGFSELRLSACDWDIKIDLDAFWKEVKRIRKNDNSPTLHFCTTKYGFDLYNSNPKEFRYDLVWNKEVSSSPITVNKMPMRRHEMIYVFSKVGSYYKRKDISGDFKSWKREQKKESIFRQNGCKKTSGQGKEGMRCVLSVINQPRCTRRGGHPTEKSVELYKFLIERYCPVDGTVLDPTFGSGNSARAAKELGRNYIGIEMNKDFYDKAKCIAEEVEVNTITNEDQS